MSIINNFVDAFIILFLILGIWLFRSPRSARFGNLCAVVSIFCAMVLVFWRSEVLNPSIVLAFIVIGGLIGYLVAVRVTMIQMPAMVAFQHGVGGIAAFLISYVELTRMASDLSPFSKVSGILGLAIGAATFSASMLASCKLSGRLNPHPVKIPAHSLFLILTAGLIVFAGFMAWNSPNAHVSYQFMIILAVAFGVIFAIRIGGADMPVLISFLNATAGFAAAFCGSVINSRLLVACGATVAASGSVLTIVMCRAMNRSLLNIFIGTSVQSNNISLDTTEDLLPERPQPEVQQTDPLEKAHALLQNASSIIIIPGYGMAMARAQIDVASLVQHLESQGKFVRFAIHPVAGRMPGHMNVLLAEADVSYDKLVEMEEINEDFKNTDLVIVVGACDVVNPAATEQEGTPISGMPILKAHEAGNVIVCNLDTKPGYSGVPNTLYLQEKTVLLFGDARIRIQELIQGI